MPYALLETALACRGPIVLGVLVCAEAFSMAVNNPIGARAKSVVSPYDAIFQAGGFGREEYREGYVVI
jgi:hypothetical protein